MDAEYLSGLLKLLEELQAAIKSKDEKSIRNLDQRDGQIEKYIGSMEHLADVLRLCQSKYGCHNEYVHSALDWVSAATPSKGLSPYPALWDNLANKKFVDELRRWIKEVSGKAGDEIRMTPETEQNAAAPKENQSHVFNIQNSNVICGDVKAKNVQTENYSRIQKHIGDEEKRKGIFKKLLGVIGAIIVAIIAAVVVDLLGRFGWFERIYSIFWPK